MGRGDGLVPTLCKLESQSRMNRVQLHLFYFEILSLYPTIQLFLMYKHIRLA